MQERHIVVICRSGGFLRHVRESGSNFYLHLSKLTTKWISRDPRRRETLVPTLDSQKTSSPKPKNSSIGATESSPGRGFAMPEAIGGQSFFLLVRPTMGYSVWNGRAQGVFLLATLPTLFGGSRHASSFLVRAGTGALGMTTLLATQQLSSAPANVGKDLKSVSSLPISRVILFSSGVGHFSRSAEVEGDARVDLTFPEQDINDLIKSMTLRDYSEKGRVTAVTYDSQDPIDRTFRSFAINLNNNPYLCPDLESGPRGERGSGAQPERRGPARNGARQSDRHRDCRKPPTRMATSEAEVLNLWCTEGVRAIKLAEVQRLRFSNPGIGKRNAPGAGDSGP